MADLNIFRMHPDVNLPEHKTMGAACFDLEYNPAGKESFTVYQPNNSVRERPLGGYKDAIIMPRERALLPTGLIFDIPKNFSVRIHPRSSVAVKRGIPLVNCEGVVDEDYVHEIFLTVINMTDTQVVVSPGERIAQAELVQQFPWQIKELKKAPSLKGDRKGGLGSTGK